MAAFDTSFPTTQYAKSVTGGEPNKGTVSGGVVNFDLADGPNQRLTVGGDLTVTYSSWPKSGIYGEIEIELVNGGAHTITWPTVHWLKGDGTNSTTFSTMGVTLSSSGANVIVVWTTDGGATVYGSAA
jgi:hypothetical protein